MEESPLHFPDRIFVTGTGTDVGKTVVSGILMAGLKGTYWKPLQSGLEEITDTQWIREKTGLDESRFPPERFRLTRPLSPHAAARLDGISIRLTDFRIPDPIPHPPLIIEGAGGVLVPLNETDFMADLMKTLGAPVLLIASSALGTINHTLLSLSMLRRYGLDILGVVMNGPRNPGNREAIEHYGKVGVLAEIEPLAEITPDSLERAFRRSFAGTNGFSEGRHTPR